MEKIFVAIFPTNFQQDDCRRFFEVLSAEERARALHQRVEADRVRYIVTRAMARQLLARLARTIPQEIVFGSNPFGKPLVSWPPQAARIHFNVSHSDELAAIAVTAAAEIGIDLEQMSVASELLELAGRFFADDEYQWLVSLPESEQLRGFYRIWTLKEATLKAIGIGLTDQLDRVTVDLSNGQPVLTVRPEACRKGWSAVELNVPQGYSAALAVALERMPPVQVVDAHQTELFA
jgi:4'-phosphopantetheinyl transferase